MTAEDVNALIERIRKWHYHEDDFGVHSCGMCAVQWPCDAIRAADALALLGAIAEAAEEVLSRANNPHPNGITELATVLLALDEAQPGSAQEGA